MLAERRDPTHEYYVAVLNDRGSNGPVLVASAQGGMNIEEVAAKDPDAIITTPIHFQNGLDHATAIGVAKKLGFQEGAAQEEAAKIFINLYKIFKDKDATQIEINPMAETTDGAVLWYILILFYFIFEFTSELLTAWMPSSALTTTLSSARRTCSTFATSPRRSHPKLRPRRRTLTSSSSTVMSAA
jgi:hypothetical protein